MLRILTFTLILGALLSPVSAQQAAAPYFFSPDVHAAFGVTGLMQNESSCVVGNREPVSWTAPLAEPGPLLIAPVPDAPARPFNPGPLPAHALAATHYDMTSGQGAARDLQLLSLPATGTGDYHLPRSLTWLPHGESLFISNPGGAHDIAVGLPLLFPGLGQRGNRSTSLAGATTHPQHAASVDRAHVAGLRDAALAGSYHPASVLPASLHNARAGLDKLYHCLGTNPPQPESGDSAPSGAAAPHSPAVGFPGEVHQAVTDIAAMGRVYRATHSSGPALVVYQFVSAAKGELAFWVTQAEVNAAGVGCVKASADRRIAAIKQDNGNVAIAMGPDAENKTFHVIFSGGVSGDGSGTALTFDGPPGAAC